MDMTPFNLGGIVLLLICLAAIPGAIAEKKGRAFFAWYVYGFFLFVVAVIHALALQPNDQALMASGRRRCRACREWVDARASICPHCRTQDPAATVVPPGP